MAAPGERIVIHLDLDAFFASVEERDKPYLSGAPIVVGADPVGGKGRGVVATASYAARAYGIRSATPISKAWRLCAEAKAQGKPPCIFITPRFGKYGRASEEVFSLVRARFSQVEQVSVDEAYIDASACKTFTRATRAARALQKEIRVKAGLSASFGIGPNKLVAKLAAGVHKPAGFLVVLPDEAEAFLQDMPIGDIPGIGRAAVARLTARGIRTVRDARMLSWQELRRTFGSWAFDMYERLRAIDNRTVSTEASPPLSIGKHYTFDTDTLSRSVLLREIERQASRITHTMHAEGFCTFRTVTLTVRFHDFSTVTRALTLPEGRSPERELFLKATKLFLPFLESRENPGKKRVRLVGVSVSKLA